MAKKLSHKQAIEEVMKRKMPLSKSGKYVNMLLYGRNGSQKTRTACKSPNPLVVDINEEGTESVADYDEGEVFHVRNWEEIFWVYWFLREADHDFGTVVLDNMTNLQHMCMSHVLKEAEDRDPNRPPKTPAQRDWGTMAHLMQPLITNFKNLPMHTIFIAQVKNADTEDDSGELVRESVPNLSPRPRGVLLDSVDVIGYMYQREVEVPAGKKGKKTKRVPEARMLIGPSDRYVTKDRIHMGQRVVQEPSIHMFIEAKHAKRERLKSKKKEKK